MIKPVLVLLSAVSGLFGAGAVAATPPPAGVWASSGYGWILQIDANGSQQLYHSSGGKCAADNGDGAIRELASMSVVRSDADGKGFTAFTRQNVTRFHFSRLDALPAACTKSAANANAIENFEYVWQTFADHYAFFPERGIDWFQTYERFRPLVKATSTPDELYTVLVAMFATLDDRHITLNRPGSEEYRSGLGPVIDPIKGNYLALPAKEQTDFYEYLLNRLAPHKQLIADRYLGQSAQSAANDQIAWGRIGDVGYLRVDSMSSYAESEGYASEAKVLAGALYKAFKLFSGARGVILDLRFNLGGNDGHGLAIAGRFTDHPYPGYTKYARDHDGGTMSQPLTVKPTGSSPFLGPAYLLTSNVTVSGGENQLLAMMGRPGAQRYGETTASVMSDQLTKTMPNGWTFSVSNEVFKAIDERVYEVRGIAPDVLVKSSVLLEPATSDPVIERVLQDVQSQKVQPR